MNRKLRWPMLIASVLSLGACATPQPTAVQQSTTIQQRYDRAWVAASGALNDQGVTITAQDRTKGLIRGERSGATITAIFNTMPDGSIQVKFSSKGDNNDLYLLQQLSDSYSRRMDM